MSRSPAPGFSGFTPDAYQFLFDLAANNERSWFQPRKADYERLLKEPMERLCEALAERFVARGIPLRSDPVRSPFRIYRDVRFSKNKAPYKTNVAAGFPWEGDEPPADDSGTSGGDGSRRHGVGGYFHLSFDGSYVGGGMWHPPADRLAAFRRLVDREPERVDKVLADAAFVARFGEVSGDRLQRMPQGYRADHPRAELLKLKDVGFWREVTDADVTSAALPDLLADDFERAVPLMRLLAELDRPSDPAAA